MAAPRDRPARRTQKTDVPEPRVLPPLRCAQGKLFPRFPPAHHRSHRDPLWDNIRVDHPALLALDRPPSSGFATLSSGRSSFLVYPGANPHSFRARTRRVSSDAASTGRSRGAGRLGPATEGVPGSPHGGVAARHRHYPFSHALEEAAFRRTRRGCRQALAGAVSRAFDPDRCPISSDRWSPHHRVEPESAPGTHLRVDLDKVDYLSRDARMSGCPTAPWTGPLLSSLTVSRSTRALRDRRAGEGERAGVAPVSPSTRVRNVYWHHAVRSATCMFKRAVRIAVRRGL